MSLRQGKLCDTVQDIFSSYKLRCLEDSYFISSFSSALISPVQMK
jgi:hypothetical protein